MKSHSYIYFTVGLLLLATIEQAGAAPYGFSVDSVSVTGQLSFADEFNGSSLSSDWEITDGSVVVANGFATLTNPGSIFFDSINGVSYIQEDSFFQSTFSLQDSGGSFEATAIWQEGAPGPDELFGFEIVSHTATGQIQTVSISVGNFDTRITDALGLSAGPGIFFGTRSDPVSGATLIPNSTTEPIMLRLSFDDSTNLFTGSYNLGSAWVEFSSHASLEPGGSGNFQLGFDGSSIQVVPIPSAVWLLISGLIGLIGVARGKKS